MTHFEEKNDDSVDELRVTFDFVVIVFLILIERKLIAIMLLIVNFAFADELFE